ncbi:hypothetical protein BC827DRAFT_59967 [Russula dissimulans]|nr:hypothetical protein BC827DRAFT_59967 [Russula dissimulans]
MDTPSPLPTLTRQSQGLMDRSGAGSGSSGPAALQLERSPDNAHYARYSIAGPHSQSVLGLTPRPSVTIPVPKVIQDSISTIASTLDKSLVPVEWDHLVPIVIVVCVETAFLKWIRRSNEDVLSTLFFTFLLGSFAWPLWFNLKHIHRRLDDVSGKIEALQQSIKSLETTPVVRPPVGHFDAPAVPDDPVVWPKEDSTSKLTVNPVVDSVEPQVDTDELPHSTHKHPALETPTVIETLSPYVSATPERGHGQGIVIQGMEGNIFQDVGTAGGSATHGEPTQGLAFGHWLPALREIKQRLEQFTEGRLLRMSHLDQSEASNTLFLRRCAVRLLMSSASLSPVDFASPIGYLGPPESTPYYPTGDLQGDRIIAFTIAMDRLDDLDSYLKGNDNIGIATKLFELAQALSDLGLHEYAFNTSGYALDALERPYKPTPGDTRLQLALVLSLRANILSDLKRSDEAVDTADRAVSLCREHRDARTTPVPELSHALLNYAVLLCGIGLKDESAAVAFELFGEVDESQPDMKSISALCKLCILNSLIGSDDDTALSMAEEAIDLTRTSSDGMSQTLLAGALLHRSKLLSSSGQNDLASSSSAEAVTILRKTSSTRPVFSLFLAHALDTHAHNLSEANRKGESYSIRRDAVELWQMLKVSAHGAVARPLARSLFHLAEFRRSGSDRNSLREELKLAESAVEVFREVVPLDVPGLGDALYLVAARMLDLDNNREAATYAEESAQNFREALSKDPKYALDLMASLSLASSCLACTERANDAFEYAKQAVEVLHERKAAGAEDKQHDARLRKLLMDVLVRAGDVGKEAEALPWLQELQALGGLEEGSGNLLTGKPQHKEDEPKKETVDRMSANTGVSNSNNVSVPSAPVASGLSLDKGKEKEGAPSSDAGISTLRVDKGKAKEVDPLIDPTPLGRRVADEEIFSPGAAAAQRRLSGLGNAGPPLGNMFGGGPGGNDILTSLLGMGPGMGGRMPGGGTGRPIGSVGSSPGSPNMGANPFGGLGIPGLGMGGGSGGMGVPGGRMGGTSGLSGGLGDMDGLMGGFNGLTESLFGNLSRLGPGHFNDINKTNVNGDTATSQSSPAPRTGTWSGTGIQSRLSDEET